MGNPEGTDRNQDVDESRIPNTAIAGGWLLDFDSIEIEEDGVGFLEGPE